MECVWNCIPLLKRFKSPGFIESEEVITFSCFVWPLCLIQCEQSDLRRQLTSVQDKSREFVTS